jgi:hypothetical protein
MDEINIRSLDPVRGLPRKRQVDGRYISSDHPFKETRKPNSHPTDSTTKLKTMGQFAQVNRAPL